MRILPRRCEARKCFIAIALKLFFGIWLKKKPEGIDIVLDISVSGTRWECQLSGRKITRYKEKKALAILVIIKVAAVKLSYEKTKYIFISLTQNAGKNSI